MSKTKRKRSEVAPESRVVKARNEQTSESLHDVMHSTESGYGDSVDAENNRDCASCGTHFPSTEAYRHHREVKLLNKTAKFVDADRVRKNVHHLLCPVVKCCFSTKTKGALKVGLKYLILFDELKMQDHLRSAHSQKLPKSLLTISRLSLEEIKIASHPCGICCKNFSSATVMCFSAQIVIITTVYLLFRNSRPT